MTKKPTMKTDRRGMFACRVCGCTHDRACAGGCSWVETDLCSTCDAVLRALFAWSELAYRPSVTAVVSEFRKWKANERVAKAAKL